MKYLLTTILTIVAIQWNFAWNGFNNVADFVKCFDENGKQVEMKSSVEVKEGKSFWHTETLDGAYKFDLIFWEEL